MIHHLSIAAQEPERVARVLAELLKGHSFPFPVHPGSFMVLADDEHGTGIEVYPAESVLTPGQGEEQVIYKSVNPTTHYSSTHIALSVPVDEQTIISIGNREGWRVLPCDRGPFELIEFWLENRFMIELLMPSMLPKYFKIMHSQSWENGLSQMAELSAQHQGA